MKPSKNLAFALLLFTTLTTLAQPSPSAARPDRPKDTPQTPVLSPGRFDLDFPGGKPRDLVAAIERALGHQINAIVPDDYADTQLPALKMKNVDVPQLFQALEAASHRQEFVTTSTYYGGAGPGGYSSVQSMITGYGFRRAPSDNNPENPVWYFYVEKPNYPGQSSNKVCRFYPLAGYLEQGISVDDITTAIATGARMLDEPGPAISFHKETKLLIVMLKAEC